jgi:hypothetical protein
MAYQTDEAFKTHPDYIDAHCAGFCGWACPQHADQVRQQAADRGYWDGSRKREKALWPNE